MRHILIAVCAALAMNVVAGVAPALADGQSRVEVTCGKMTPPQIADKIAAAMKTDNAEADLGAGLGRPIDWLNKLDDEDRPAGIGDSNNPFTALDSYLRALVGTPAPSGKTAWRHPKTGHIAMLCDSAPKAIVAKAPQKPKPAPPARVAVVPPPPPPPCREIVFSAPIDTEVDWGVATSRGPLPPSECNAQREGLEPWTAWLGVCPGCTPPHDAFDRVLDGVVQTPHSYAHKTNFTRQYLRFHPAIEGMVVWMCLKYPDGGRSCTVDVRPQDWQGGRTVVEISDAILRPDIDCFVPR